MSLRHCLIISQQNRWQPPFPTRSASRRQASKQKRLCEPSLNFSPTRDDEEAMFEIWPQVKSPLATPNLQPLLLFFLPEVWRSVLARPLSRDSSGRRKYAITTVKTPPASVCPPFPQSFSCHTLLVHTGFPRKKENKQGGTR